MDWRGVVVVEVLVSCRAAEGLSNLLMNHFALALFID